MASIATLSLPIDALSDTTLAAIWKDIDAAWGETLGPDAPDMRAICDVALNMICAESRRRSGAKS